VLPDGLAGQVIRDDFTPRFREGDYSGGIRNGVLHLVTIVEKHQVLTPEEVAKLNRRNVPEYTLPGWTIIPFFGLFVSIGFAMLGIGLRTKTLFPVLFGAAFGGIPILMSMVFTYRLTLFTLVPWAIAVLVLGYRMGGRKSFRDAFRDGGKAGGSSGWTMGTTRSSGSRGSSGSSSSSSSSFGGGSSGGGGASGKW
jgi:uncharacterized protein